MSNEEQTVEQLDEQASGGKPRRTRRAITPATAIPKCIAVMEKLDAKDLRQTFACLQTYFKDKLVDPGLSYPPGVR